MKNDVLQLMFGVLALVLGAGCEELLPKALGVGFPILLMVVAGGLITKGAERCARS